MTKKCLCILKSTGQTVNTEHNEQPGRLLSKRLSRVLTCTGVVSQVLGEANQYFGKRATILVVQ